VTSIIIPTLRRARSALLTLAVAAVGVSFAPAVIAPTAASALPIQGVKKCTPGDIKTVGGKKYVCDKNGKWIHVVAIAAAGSTTGTLTTASAQITPTGSNRFQSREANNGGTPVTCGMGSKPGDYMEERTYIYRNGQRIGFVTTTYICGKDGNWHAVAAVTAQTGVVSSAATGTISAVRP
jgi:hypothetical protein